MIQFNLVDEPFIRVIGVDGCMHEVSLKEAIVNAHNYADIGGDMATQDVAVLRLLLAIVHTIITRFDAQGVRADIGDEDEALERWQEIWQMGRFPEGPILSYFEQWYQRFWLFHPERPFYQIPDAHGLTTENVLEKSGLNDPDCNELKTKQTFFAAKLNGEIGESANKVRLFSPRSGQKKRSLSFAEAARWLLAQQAFDDASGKESKENKNNKVDEKKQDETLGVGWLGKLSLVHAVGKNLFETLMLNCVLLYNGEKMYREDLPVWEKDLVDLRERHYIAVPDNFAELLTLQSRRILLIPMQHCVVGYVSYGGDYFSKRGALKEQFTMWELKKGGKGETRYPVPRNDMPTQMWREISSLLIEGTESNKREIPPGIVLWIKRLMENNDSLGRVAFQYTKMKYGPNNSSPGDCVSDNLSISSSLLAKIHENYLLRIIEEVKTCAEAASAIYIFAENLYVAEGGDTEGKQYKNNKDNQLNPGEIAEEQFYSSMDGLFRTWLLRLTGNEDAEEFDEKAMQFRNDACKQAFKSGEILYESSSPAGFMGHGKGDGKKKRYSSIEAYLIFQRRIKRLFRLY